ncbi:MucBP domain-containing protein [Lactococcus lactis]|uniref:MucBP domain-containing protein n=1 Tax=Lactococcus lactis TaxID=1358 RepID=A0A9X4NJ02_9LACT|nr:MucBP domain-containing protein [Lactococcus lactis]MDG4984971.1 MucBP domain-containing protein [Lactococcus lactis]
MGNKINFRLASILIITTQLTTMVLPAVDADTLNNNSQNKNTQVSQSLSSSYIASLVTNANNTDTGGELELALNLSITDENVVIPAGTKFTISIDPKAIDYNSIDFSDPTLSEYFTYSKDSTTGKMVLILKQDVLGKGTKINPKIHVKVTGEPGKSYKIQSNVSDGTNVLITNDTINTTGIPDYHYGTINTYWGKYEGQDGNFIGKAANLSNTGIFSRSKNNVEIFGEFNTTYQKWSSFIDNKDKWVSLKFNYDSKETLDVSSINIYDKTKNYSTIPYTTNPTGDGSIPIVKIDKINHNFEVLLKSTDVVGGDNSQDVLVVNYSTNVDDATLTYDNSMVLKNEQDTELAQYGLHSIFSEEGNSNIFPTISAKDLRFPLGQLNENNAEAILKSDASATAKDTKDGVIDPTKISVDTSKIDFSKPGTYTALYKVKNSSGKTAGKTYKVIIYQSATQAVTINYVDEDGKKIHDSNKIVGNIGDTYDASGGSYQLKIKGYILDQSKVPGNIKGVISDGNQVVTYVYTKLPPQKGMVNVKYVDTDGNQIAKEISISGNLGQVYTTEKKLFNGYTFKEVRGNISGKLEKNIQNVIYVYIKNTEKNIPTVPAQDDNVAEKKLPVTGENEQLTLLGVGLGSVAVCGAVIITYFRFLKKK